MQMRALGSAPFPVSAVGLGCNNFGRRGTTSFDQGGTTAVVDAALDAGVTFFDTADIYGAEYGLSETRLGEAIRGRRDRVIVATKFGHAQAPSPLPGARGSRAYIRAAVEGSLERLGTDRIDLYQQHTPDPSTPIEETLGALDELVQEGKVVAIGHSNFDAAQIAAAEQAASLLGTVHFVSAQNEYNLLSRGVAAEVLPAANAAGLGFLPYFPLANGLFTGKFSRTERPADSRIAMIRPQVADEAPWDAMDAYAAFCAERGVTMLQATIGWLLAQPGLASVIAGATKPEQIRANAEAASAWSPAPDDVRAISDLFPVVA
ncbi:aldo/keto reductase [Pseudolysinimonas sp.]|uniref:aldo/keto reductase n=1 Tax=Pseudolysinimonas sp. TaxID=2680009 RepID=UPI003F7EFA13